MQYDFSFFEYWASDYAGHRQDMDWAIEQLENFDGVLGGLLDTMPDDLLVLLTSDHGNMENLGTRRHTDVKVPCLLFGTEQVRKKFIGEKVLFSVRPQSDREVNPGQPAVIRLGHHYRSAELPLLFKAICNAA